MVLAVMMLVGLLSIGLINDVVAQAHKKICTSSDIGCSTNPSVIVCHGHHGNHGHDHGGKGGLKCVVGGHH